MTSQMKRAAIVYDFDGTLAQGNIQEVSFIPRINMAREDFWAEVKRRTRETDGDEVLIYMNLMLEKAREAGVEVTREKLRDHGKEAKLFDGLRGGEWFKRTSEFASKHDLCLEHYIISSANQELIEGCEIYDQFRQVFASRYMYDANGNAIWPSLAINYTTKTQFLFRINKGIENTWDREAINRFMQEDKRPVPFTRMIFIGDGDTDIPAMKMVTYKEGYSIAVYDPQRDRGALGKIHSLISEDRVDFVAQADYSENSQIDIIIRGILGRIARAEGFEPIRNV